MSEISQNFADAVLRALMGLLHPARIGRENSDKSITVRVTDRPHWIYVREGPDGQERTVSQAFPLFVPPRANYPVLLLRVMPSVRLAVSVDWTRAEAYLGGELQISSVSAHSHAIGTGLEYEHPALMADVGRVKPLNRTDLQVLINAFYYRYNGVVTYWPGGIIDLTSVKTATSGEWSWILIGVDPSDNTANVVAGSSQSTTLPLTEDQIADISYDNKIPCGAVRLKNSDTVLNDIARFADARQWLGPSWPDIDSLTDESSVDGTDDRIVMWDNSASAHVAVSPDDFVSAASGAAYTEGARVYNSGNISINDITNTVFTFDSERYDTDSIHDTGSNTSRLTCNTGGKYLIVGNVRWDTNATGIRFIRILLNGVTYIAETRFDAAGNHGGSWPTTQVVTTVYALSATDYVELEGYQSSGGALNALAVGNLSLEFMMQRIG